jgi:hypothetical protein
MGTTLPPEAGGVIGDWAAGAEGRVWDRAPEDPDKETGARLSTTTGAVPVEIISSCSAAAWEISMIREDT